MGSTRRSEERPWVPRAMYVLDAAALRRRFGPAVLWAWRIVRYLRLRRQSEHEPGGDDGQ